MPQTITTIDIAKLRHAEQPTGAHSVLVLNGTQVVVGTTGTVQQVTGAGTFNTPPLFLYSNSRIVAFGVSGTGINSAFSKWADAGNTASQQRVDVSPLPGIVSNGTLNVPCRGDSGLIEFEETGTLVPGNYRLTVESGNIGQTDTDFSGFNTEITVNSSVAEKTLLAGGSGFNLRGLDQFDIAVSDRLVGNWLLSFLWTNPYRNLAAGAERQLAIYSYSLRRLASELFRVDIAASGTIPLVTPLDTANWTSGTTPGGWLHAINSYGTRVSVAHESQVYSSNDTIISSAPLSEVLTGLTSAKREDIVVSGPEFVVRDGGSFTYPAIGTLSPSNGVMHQTGELVTFSLPPVSGTAIYAYAWKWWDGTSQATTGTSASRELNIGGAPGSGGAGTLFYTVTPVASDGQAKTVYGSIRVNNPPVIVPSPMITVNDTFVPYDTRLSLYAFDFENNLPLIFSWWDTTTSALLSATGTTLGTTVVSGTWHGNGTASVANYTASGNYYNAHVTAGQNVRCQVVDTLAGTTSVAFNLRGYTRPPPASGIAAAANFTYSDSSALPVKRIGAGEYFDFEVDARDFTGAGLTFLWNFAGTNNWTVPSYGAGTSSLQPDGSYRSLYRKDLTGEVVATGTSKVAEADCRVTNGTSRTDVSISVVLLKNNPPSSITVTVRDETSQTVFTDLTQIPVNSLIQLEAVPVDADDDVVTFAWAVVLTGSAGQLGTAFPTTYADHGPKMIVRTAGATAGLHITGSVTATDRVGGTSTLILPTMILV